MKKLGSPLLTAIFMVGGCSGAIDAPKPSPNSASVDGSRLTLDEFDLKNQDKIRTSHIYNGVCSSVSALLAAGGEMSIPDNNLWVAGKEGSLVILDQGVFYVDNDLDGEVDSVYKDSMPGECFERSLSPKKTDVWTKITCESTQNATPEDQDRHRGNLWMIDRVHHGLCGEE